MSNHEFAGREKRFRSPQHWVKRSVYAAAALAAVGGSVAVTAAVIGLPTVTPTAGNGVSIYMGPNDESHGTVPVTGLTGDAMLAAQAPSNMGALQVPDATGAVAYGSKDITPLKEATTPGTQSVPSGAPPSPLFGAQPWSQDLLLFEEFGPEKLDAAAPASLAPLPSPLSAQYGPDGAALNDFLGQSGIFPFPTRVSNTIDKNPWAPEIKTFLGRPVDSSPAEGRAPGEGWAHQRWEEFAPQTFFKTAQAAAHANNGFRDHKQMHDFSVGEWAAGGLYHRTGTNAGTQVQFHPNFPVQTGNSVWTFDGTMPPKLLMARYGEPTMMRHYNALPIDPSANKGFGLHTITTHEHNGHNPAESDGFANAFFFPGQFYDYRWPIQLAGYDTINTNAADPKAAYPCKVGERLKVKGVMQNCVAGKDGVNGTVRIPGDWHETMSTHWFHDHMLDFTSQNVYKGNAVMMNYYSAIDRGNEAVDDGVNLKLPSGSALSWGNRDYDINLVIGDKAWDKDGQLWFNPFQKNGFIGDRLLVNWAWKPNLDVRARRYRFRILDGGVARFLALGLVRECVAPVKCEYPGPASKPGVSYDRVPFHMVANDGNIMGYAVPFDGKHDLDANGNADEHKGTLPEQGIAERYDIVVDFAANGIKAGDKLYFVNTMEHTTGVAIGKKIPVADIVSERYKAVETPTRYTGGDPGVGPFMQLTVKPYAGKDLSMNPVDYEPGKKSMIPLVIDRTKPADQKLVNAARHRTFTFGHANGTDAEPWTVSSDGGRGYNADMRRVSAAPRLAYDPTYKDAVGNVVVNAVNNPNAAGSSGTSGELEVWKIVLGGGWSHPVHIHFEEGVILRRGGKLPPDWEKWARKDVYRIGPGTDSDSSVEVALHFREFAGTFVEHCHNTTHEDNAMLLRWDIEHPGQFVVMPTPLPSWDGVKYTGSAALATFRSGDAVGPSFKF
jgi:FtsP/CotA-like multicopper oxidase with cupredoxin domain